MRLGLLAAAAVAALAAAVPAGGAPQKQVGFSPVRVLANGATYVDPQGDSDFVPDIVLVVVSNDNAGTVTFEVGFTNRPDGLTADDVIQIRIDSDGAYYTGRNGFETMLQVSAYGLEVLKDANGDYALTDTPVRGVFSGGLLTLQLSIRDLADTASIRFYVAADSLSSSPGIYDWAPDGDSLFRYIVDVPLLLDAWQTVQPKAGTTAALTGAFTTNDAVPGTVTCAATLLGKRIAGTGRWTTATVLPAVPPSPDIARPGPYAYKATAGCSFKLPKTARRKTLKGTITVSKDGVVVRRAFSYRVR